MSRCVQSDERLWYLVIGDVYTVECAKCEPELYGIGDRVFSALRDFYTALAS